MSAFGVAESPEGDSLYGSPPGRSFYSCASSRALLHVGSLSLWDRQPTNAPPRHLYPPGRASPPGPQKLRAGFLWLDIVGAGFCKGINCTARRRGVPFVRTRRRGLCSMSGRYPYGIGNPPTLRRSSFPQRALRPAGGPIPKHAWGCAPRPPNA